MLGANGVADAAAYLYGLNTNPPTTVVNAPTVGGNASISVAPSTAGTHTLYVRSRDRAGNLSPITSYTFTVNTATGWATPRLTAFNAYAGGTQATVCASGGGRPTITTSTMNLSATYSATTGTTTTTTFEWWDVVGTEPLGSAVKSSVPLGQAASATMPSTVLETGAYKWRVQASNTTATSPWSARCEFAVEFPYPDIAEGPMPAEKQAVVDSAVDGTDPDAVCSLRRRRPVTRGPRKTFPPSSHRWNPS